MYVCDPNFDYEGILFVEGGGGGVNFNDNDGGISLDNLVWDQMMFENLVDVFEMVGLHNNLNKNKVLVCTPGLLWGNKE